MRNFFRKGIILLVVGIALCSYATAQQVASKINNGATKAAQTKKTVDDAKGAVADVKNTFNGLFGKKKPKEQAKEPPVAETPIVSPAAKTTSIEIGNIEYGKLKELEEAIKSLSGVTSTNKKFSAALSSIEVAYNGKADELWELLPKELRAMFELKDLSDGKIILETKKS